MTVPYRKSLAFFATATLLAGCSTAPTITVPNPLAALNNALTMPQTARAPSGYVNVPTAGVYQPAPANYGTVVPSYTSAAPTYSSVNTGYTMAAPSYTTSAPSFTASAPAYSTGSQTFGTVQTSAPSYTISAPVASTGSTYTLGSTVAAAPAYSTGAAMVETSAIPMQSYASSVPTLGTVQPVQASGTTYDLTTPAMASSFDPSAGLTVDTGYGTLSAPVQQSVSAPAMGGSFQVTQPSTQSLGGGIATYNAAPVTLGVPSYSY